MFIKALLVKCFPQIRTVRSDPFNRKSTHCTIEYTHDRRDCLIPTCKNYLVLIVKTEFQIAPLELDILKNLIKLHAVSTVPATGRRENLLACRNCVRDSVITEPVIEKSKVFLFWVSRQTFLFEAT